MVDKVTQANKKIAAAAAKDTAKKMAAGPVGAKMMEMMNVPSFARGLTPQILIDLAKDKKIITPEQQADFKNRVGKDRTALAEFNEIVTKADEPRLAYKGQSPAQIELLRAKGLTPATSINKTQRITLLKDTHTILNEAAAMDAPKEVKEKTFIDKLNTAKEGVLSADKNLDTALDNVLSVCGSSLYTALFVDFCLIYCICYPYDNC